MRMKWKRWLAALMVAAMAISALPTAAFAEGNNGGEDSSYVEETLTGGADESTGDGEADDQEKEDPSQNQEKDQTGSGEEEKTEESTPQPSEQPSEQPEESQEPEPAPEPIQVTFQLGGEESQVVELSQEATGLAAEQIPTQNADGKVICRWVDDSGSFVTPAQATITENTTYTAWYAPELIQDHNAYVNGMGGGKFEPNGTLTRAQAVTMFYGLLVDQSQGSFPASYSDVTEDKWYYTAITTLASLGILDCDGGSYGPNEAMTRGEFAALVATLLPESDATGGFTDVPADHPYASAIAACQAKGWIEGFGDGTFGPEDTLTRAQAVTIFNRILGRSADSNALEVHKDDLRSFSDVKAGSWYYLAVMEAAITHTPVYDANGTESWNGATWTITVTYQVGSTTITEKVYPGSTPVSVPTKSADGTAITRWIDSRTGSFVVPSSQAAVENQNETYIAWFAPALNTDHAVYVEGYGNGNFGPNNQLTRAEADAMVYRLLANKTAGSYASSFSDVASGSWYYTAVTTLASLKLIDAGGAYGPNEPMTRGEFAELVARLTTPVTSTTTFTDVSADDPHYAAIMTCAAKGWIQGYGDGTFGPDNTLTRAEAVTLLNRILGRSGDSYNEKLMDSRFTFSDVAAGSWYFTAVMEAATTHTYTTSGSSESWTSYYKTGSSTNWESSDSVVKNAKILTSTISSTYTGNYSQSYNVDYSNKVKENYINGKGYTSSSHYLLWINRASQKVNVFYSETGAAGTWSLVQEFICGSGASGTQTPVGVTYITYKQYSGWTTSTYTVAPVVRFYPGTGYAFHSRLYYPSSSTLKSAAIGYPISHGCIRMLTPDVTWIYNNCPDGSTVVVY